MTETPGKTAGNLALTMSDRELLEDIHRMLARLCGTLDALGINGKVTYMDLAGIARKVRKSG